MSTQRLPTTQSYDLFKAAVTFLLLLAVLLAVAFNSGSTQAAEEEPVPNTNSSVHSAHNRGLGRRGRMY